MKYLISYWDIVAARIRETEHILLLLDYDGTLTPIVKRPELAHLSPGVKECLRELAGNPRLTVAIISGRALGDLQERVGVKDITYVGNHGLEIEGPGVSFVNPAARQAVPLLYSLWQDIDKAITDINGARIDDKGLTLSFHYRLVDEPQLEKVNHIFNETVKTALAAGQIKITPSKKAYDIRPAVDWDKGKAIEFIAQKVTGCVKPLMLFLGDDITDYDGFHIVDKNGGISIFVGAPSAKPPAQYFLYSPKEVYRFLGMLREVISVQ